MSEVDDCVGKSSSFSVSKIFDVRRIFFIRSLEKSVVSFPDRYRDEWQGDKMPPHVFKEQLQKVFDVKLTPPVGFLTLM